MIGTRGGNPCMKFRDLLEVECWCMTTTVFIPKAMVAAGLTESCGRKGCEG